MMAQRPLRILHLRVVRGTGGGPDKTTLRGCAWLRRGGHIADAFYMLDAREDGGNLQRLAAELGVPMHVAMERSPLSLATLRRLGSVLAAGNYDILHTHEYKSNALAQLARLMHVGPVVATSHGYNQTTRREAFYYGVERACFRHVQAIICPTQDMWRLLRRMGLPASRLHVIPNGIETAGRERPSRQATASCRLLYLGRLSREKDVANLLQAASLLRQRGVRFQLTVAGDGPERASLEQQSRDLLLESHVRFLGFVSDVASLLGDCDVLVNPSRTECMPNSVLEAMWAGAAVVATDVGGLSEMIDHRVHGLLVPPNDANALADAVTQLVRDEDLRRQLADNAMARVDAEFTFESRMQRVLALYRCVLAEQGHCKELVH